MERLRRNQSTKVVDNKLRLVIIALAAVGLAETTAYAEAMTGWRDRLAAARADRDAKVIALRTANREVVRLDKAVDRGTVQVGQGYLDHIDQNRLDPTFLLAFPIAPSDATAPLATDRQTLYVRNAITVLRSVPDLPVKLVRRIDALEAAQLALEAGLTRRTAARQAAALAEGQLEAVQTAAANAYNQLYFHLGPVFGGDKAKVEAVFKG